MSDTPSTPSRAPSHTQQWDHLAAATLEHLTTLSFRQGNLDSYLDEIARGVSQLISIDWSIVTLSLSGDEATDLPTRSKIIASSTELESSDYEPYSLHGSVAQTVVKTRCPLAVADTDAETHHGANPPGYRAYLGIPLKSSTGKLLGTICSFHQQPRQFSPEEIKCVELFAERATTAIDNFQLYQQQLKFNEVLEAEVAKRTAQLKAAQAQLIEKERLAAIGEFTSMIVHEIRNPLTTVRMGLLALQALELSERDRNRLTLAVEEEHRLKALLDEILQYAKPQVLDTTTFDLCELVTETVDAMSAQPLIKERQLSTVFDLPEILIEGDRNKLKQVLINLISNACEAIDPGQQVDITLALPAPSENSQNNNAQVCLKIRNGGDPIPPNILAQLTKPFFSTKSSGNGLGLAIVKRIVEAHSGSLVFTSTAEVGTAATVCFPKARLSKTAP